MSGTEGAVKRLDSTGGRSIRTLEVVTFIGGVETTVEMQVVALADEQGRPISLASQAEKLDTIALELRLNTEVQLRILKALDVQQEITRDELLELISEQEEQQ